MKKASSDLVKQEGDFFAISVANWFIKKSLKSGKKITPLKVLKLTQIAEFWHQSLFKTPLLNEKSVYLVSKEEKIYNPISELNNHEQMPTLIPSLYEAFEHYGVKPIKKTFSFPVEIKDDLTKKFLDKVWQQYKLYSDKQLSIIYFEMSKEIFK